MKLILLSPSRQKDSELPFLMSMFEQGLLTYHLRKTNFSTNELKKFIAEIPEKYHSRIVLHSHHELALKFNLKGIYISRSHKSRKIKLWFTQKWLKFRNKDIQITTTFRNTGKLYDVPRYNYVFLSPIFDTISGNTQAAFTEHNLKPLLQRTKYNVIARGGISIDKIEKVNQLGFAGVAFYSGIWKTTNPVYEFTKVKEKFAELNIPME